MKVSDIMTKDMVIADTNDTVYDVARLMKHHNIGAVPIVTEQNKVLGMVTDRDIVMNIAKYNLDTAKTLASTIMSDNVYSVKPDADVESALQLMKKQKIRRLPVIENEFLLGMVSLGDIAVSNGYKEEISEALTEISKPAKVENI